MFCLSVNHSQKKTFKLSCSFLTLRVSGSLSNRHKELIAKNPIFSGVNVSNNQPTGLKASFPTWSDYSMNFVIACLNVEPSKRPHTEDLMNYSVFSHDNFNIWWLQDLQFKLQEEFSSNPLLKIRKQAAPSAKKTKFVTDESLNKRNNEKSSQVESTVSSVPATLTLLCLRI